MASCGALYSIASSLVNPPNEGGGVPVFVQIRQPSAARPRTLNAPRGGIVSDNAAVARRWFQEVWVAGGERSVDLLMAPDAVGWMEGRAIKGPIDFKEARRTLLHVFPDLTMTVEDTIEEG